MSKNKVNYLSNFRKKFKLDPKLNLMNIAVAVEGMYQVEIIGNDALNNYEPLDGGDGLKVRTLAIINARIFEHLEAMIVAYATGSPASAEALARVVVEGSINSMYLSSKGTPSTIIDYFESWLQEHNKKLSDWKGLTEKEDGWGNVALQIEERRKVVVGLTEFLDFLIKDLNIDNKSEAKNWPRQLFRRFEVLDRVSDYYTSYHRLSGSSHITGEDTLSVICSHFLEDKQKFLMGKEAWAYSLMMTRIACLFYIDAIEISCVVFGRVDNEDIMNIRLNINKTIDDIAAEAGVPEV